MLQNFRRKTMIKNKIWITEHMLKMVAWKATLRSNRQVTQTSAQIPSFNWILFYCHKPWFSNSYIFATQCWWPWIFQTLKSVRSKNLSLKYQESSPQGCQDIGINKFEFVAKTQFLSKGIEFLPQTLIF